MKALFSRYGGHSFVIGKGRASDETLPEDQSLDNMLDNHSVEILPNVFVISSYDQRPEFMGAMQKLPAKAIKLGTIHHQFLEVMLQHELEVTTDVYVMIHQYSNVFALIIKTRKDEIEWIFDDYEESYDYVQTTFFRDANSEEDESLFKNPVLTEIMLYTLFFKMGFTYASFNFEPSNTAFGKKISKQFVDSLEGFYENINSQKELSENLNQRYPQLFIKKQQS